MLLYVCDPSSYCLCKHLYRGSLVYMYLFLLTGLLLRLSPGSIPLSLPMQAPVPVVQHSSCIPWSLCLYMHLVHFSSSRLCPSPLLEVPGWRPGPHQEFFLMNSSSKMPHVHGALWRRRTQKARACIMRRLWFSKLSLLLLLKMIVLALCAFFGYSCGTGQPFLQLILRLAR